MVTENTHKAKFISELRKNGYQYFHIDVDASASGKKPFDGMIIKNGKVMAVEFKKDYRKLEPHQKRALIDFDGAGIVIRFWSKKRMVDVTWDSFTVTVELKYKVLINKFLVYFMGYFNDTK